MKKEIKNHCSICVKVSGSSANLGPGFDSLGIALKIYDYITLQIRNDSKLNIKILGEGQDKIPKTSNNLIIKTIFSELKRLKYCIPGVNLISRNKIPQNRGLGSSAAAIVASILIVNELIDKKDKFSHNDIFNKAANIEGHADNISSVINGSFNISWTERSEKFSKLYSPKNKLFFNTTIKISDCIKPLMLIPSKELYTKVSRKILPNNIDHSLASENSARSALLIYALTKNQNYLFDATKDYLHQKYRFKFMVSTSNLLHYLRKNNYPAVISGAGPSILVFTTSKLQIQQISNLLNNYFLKNNEKAWRIQPIDVNTEGAKIIQ